KQGAFFRPVLREELAHLVDGADAVPIALSMGDAPGEQAVTAQNQSVAAGSLPHGLFDHPSQLEARALPRKPRDVAAEFAVELFELLFSVGAGGEGDAPVGVQMV